MNGSNVTKLQALDLCLKGTLYEVLENTSIRTFVAAVERSCPFQRKGYWCPTSQQLYTAFPNGIKPVSNPDQRYPNDLNVA